MQIHRTDLSAAEIKELGLGGPWFLEFDDGHVEEFETEAHAKEYVEQMRARREYARKRISRLTKKLQSPMLTPAQRASSRQSLNRWVKIVAEINNKTGDA